MRSMHGDASPCHRLLVGFLDSSIRQAATCKHHTDGLKRSFTPTFPPFDLSSIPVCCSSRTHACTISRGCNGIDSVQPSYYICCREKVIPCIRPR